MNFEILKSLLAINNYITIGTKQQNRKSSYTLQILQHKTHLDHPQ